MNLFFTILFWLIVGHSLADYPLQGEFIAKAKDRTSDLGKLFWRHALFAHAMIHAGMVAFFCESIPLGIAEAVIHAITDDLKCRKKINMWQDQTIHFACKILWAAITAWSAS